MKHRSDAETIERTRNAARFFVENRPIAWIILVAVVVWGIWGYFHIPKRKDPVIPVRSALAICPWPGVSAQKIEELVTRRMEEKIAENSSLHPPGSGNDYGIRSLTLDGIAYVYVQVAETVHQPGHAFNDINLRLNSMTDLPPGAGPIRFVSDFGDTATLMLTVASPQSDDAIVALRVRDITRAINDVRAQAAPGQQRISVIIPFPNTASSEVMQRVLDELRRFVSSQDLLGDLKAIQGAGFVGLDGTLKVEEADFAPPEQHHQERLAPSAFHTFHPDAWPPVIIRDVNDTRAIIRADAGDKYTYRHLERITNLMEHTLETVPEVAKVTRSGVMPERVFLNYSQERLASYGVVPSTLKGLLSSRNVTQSAGMINAEGTDVIIEPTGEFTESSQIGDVMVGKGPPVPRCICAIWSPSHGVIRSRRASSTSSTGAVSMASGIGAGLSRSRFKCGKGSRSVISASTSITRSTTSSRGFPKT